MFSMNLFHEQFGAEIYKLCSLLFSLFGALTKYLWPRAFCVTQVGLEFMILLPLPPQHWDGRGEPQHLGHIDVSSRIFLAFTLLILVNVYACARAHTRDTHTHVTHTHTPWYHVEVRGQFSVVTVLYPPCGFPGSSTGRQSWQQASVFNEPPHQPFFVTSDGLWESIYTLCVYFLSSHWNLFPLLSVYFILLLLIAALQD